MGISTFNIKSDLYLKIVFGNILVNITTLNLITMQSHIHPSVQPNR